MKLSKVEVSSVDLGFAAFMVCFHEINPWKITTSPTGMGEFFFRVSSVDNWEKYKTQYSTSPIVNAETYYSDVIQLQQRVKDAHRAGGIWKA
jgi:hypothetical protein